MSLFRFAIAFETEGFWDISIDTLPEYQRQGHALRYVTFMIQYMRAGGKEPVWGSAEWNEPSRRLALKLGFTPVDELLLFERTNV